MSRLIESTLTGKISKILVESQDPYEDPESWESQHLDDIQIRYDEYLQDTEGRDISYGEIAYIQSLRGKDLEDFEKELDDYFMEKEDKLEEANSAKTHKVNTVKYDAKGYTEATDGMYKGKPIVDYREKDFKKGTSVLTPFICGNCGKEFYAKSSIHDFFKQGDFDDPYETPELGSLRCPKCKNFDELEYNGEVLIKEAAKPEKEPKKADDLKKGEQVLNEEPEQYTLEYWADEECRDEGLSDLEYIEAPNMEDAIAQARKMYNFNDWASCELESPSGELIFGIYPDEGEERYGSAKKVEESAKPEEEPDKGNYEVRPGYHEWLLLKDGNQIYSFGDLTDDLPEVCSKENLTSYADELLDANEELEDEDINKIKDVLANTLYSYYGEDIKESAKPKKLKEWGGDWQGHINSGSELRKLLHEIDEDASPEECRKVLDVLKKCCQEAIEICEKKNLDEYDKNGFQSVIDDIEMIYDDEDLDSSNVDWELDGFYDWCDSARLWVELTESFKPRKKKLTEAIEGLPDFCYSSLPSDDRKVIKIVKGESGYYPLDVDFEDAEKAQAYIKDMNDKLGIDDRTKRAMETGSMWGWDVPGADPNHAMNESCKPAALVLTESSENIQAFWDKGFKPGDKISTPSGEVELIDLDKGADYIIVNRGSKYQPFVAAWAPGWYDDGLTWGQGHYFDTEEDAREYFNSKKLTEAAKPEGNVYTACYNTLDVWPDRKSALDFYMECMAGSEGSEQERYANIVVDLHYGENRADDGYSDTIWEINEMDKNGRVKSNKKLDKQMPLEDAYRYADGLYKLPDDLDLDESVTVATSDGSTVDMQDSASVSVDDNVVSVTNGQTTVTITSTPDLPVEELVSTVPADASLLEPQEEPAEEVPAEEIVSDDETVVPEETGEIEANMDELEGNPEEEEKVEESVEEEGPELEDEENASVVEAQTLDVVKNQGDVYMLTTKDAEGNEKYWVCENFDQENNEGEEAEEYDSLEDANDDYLSRVGLSDYKNIE